MDEMDKSPENLVDRNPEHHLTMNGNSKIIAAMESNPQDDVTETTGLVLDRNMVNVSDGDLSIVAFSTGSDSSQCTAADISCEKSRRIEPPLVSHCVVFQNLKSTFSTPSMHEATAFASVPDIDKSRYTMDTEKSRFPAQNNVHNMYNIHEIDHMQSVVNRNGNSIEHEDSYFGSESSMFKLSDCGHKITDVKSDNLELVDIEHAASEVSMNENSLETLFAVDNHVQDGFDSHVQNGCDLTGPCVPVHPVVLKKSKKIQKNVTAKAEGVPHGKVTMLLDLSSIDELKKLWEKSSKSLKKLSGSPMRPKQKFNAKKSVLAKAQNPERILKVSVKNKPNVTTIIKPCSVKLVNVEGLVSQIKDLVIDLTVPKRIQFPKQMKEDIITNKANKMTNICDKSKGVNKIVNESSSDHVSESLGNGFETKAQPFMPPANTFLRMEDIQPDRVNQTEDDEFPDDFYIYGDSDDDFFHADDCDYDVDFKPALTKSKKIKKTKMGKAKDVLLYIKKSEIPKTEPKVTAAEETICSTGKIESPPHLKTLCCNICNFKASDKIEVTKHNAECHGSTEMFYCRFCEKRCRTQDGIVQHEAKAHTHEKPFKCDHDGCSYESNDKRDLFVHKNKHAAEKSYCCDICDFKTRYPKNLRMHRMYTHSDERRFKCSICSFMTKRHIDLKQHMYRHTDDKPIECSHCGFRVKTNWELQSHMLKHTDEKPFKCPHPGCMQGTKTKADLKKHMVKHQEECPFVCALCGGTYKTQSRLNKHHTYVHNATRNFDCDNCGMKFKTKQSLRKHLLLHSGYKPYSCEVCGHKFANRNNMSKHMVTHDVTVRPYRCPLCPYAAKEQGHLLAHIGTFHGKSYAYFCELCKKPFQRYSRLQTHYERMHKRDIDKLINGPPLDLASLKMEMKLNLEEAEHEEQNQSSSSNVGCSQEINIKVETVDEYYEDDTSNQKKREDLMDIKLNEETREDKVVKNSNNVQQCKEMLNFAVVPDNSVNQDAESTGSDELQNKIIDDHHVIELKTMENVKIKSNDTNEFMEIEMKEKFANVNNCFNFAETVMIDKNAIATVAMYNDFRLPLATKGFQFNYEKSGKKPNTWFMDWKLMSEKEAEKQKKYLRRIGKMQPLPKRKHKTQDKTLTGFVRRRTRKLEENIRKAKFIKDNWLATKRSYDRKSRFKGNYMEFETLQGEELTVSQVQERIPRVGYPTKCTNKNVKSPFKDNKNIRRNRRNSKKQATQLPSEKVGKVKKTNRNIQFRKPAFLQNIKMEIDDAATDTYANRNSFDVLGTILTDVSESKLQSIHTREGKPSGDGQRFELLKRSGMSAKKANKKSYLKGEINDNASNKQKYNKKYVPVKLAKQRKMVSAQASNVENKIIEDARKNKTKNKAVKTVKRQVSAQGKLKIKICGKLTGRSSDFLTVQKSNDTPLADKHNNATVSFIPMSDPQIVMVCPPDVLLETNQVLDINGLESSNALLVPAISNMELARNLYFDINAGPSFDGVAINGQSKNEAVLIESGSGESHFVNANVTADGFETDLNASGILDQEFNS